MNKPMGEVTFRYQGQKRTVVPFRVSANLMTNPAVPPSVTVLSYGNDGEINAFHVPNVPYQKAESKTDWRMIQRVTQVKSALARLRNTFA